MSYKYLRQSIPHKKQSIAKYELPIFPKTAEKRVVHQIHYFASAFVFYPKNQSVFHLVAGMYPRKTRYQPKTGMATNPVWRRRIFCQNGDKFEGSEVVEKVFNIAKYRCTHEVDARGISFPGKLYSQSKSASVNDTSRRMLWLFNEQSDRNIKMFDELRSS
jgi:hypothetical protein